MQLGECRIDTRSEDFLEIEITDKKWGGKSQWGRGGESSGFSRLHIPPSAYSMYSRPINLGHCVNFISINTIFVWQHLFTLCAGYSHYQHSNRLTASIVHIRTYICINLYKLGNRLGRMIDASTALSITTNEWEGKGQWLSGEISPSSDATLSTVVACVSSDCWHRSPCMPTTAACRTVICDCSADRPNICRSASTWK